MFYENHVRVTGCLGRDPEFKSFANGGKVANLRIATTRRWKDRNSGEVREETEWHSVAVTNEGLVGLIEGRLRKGSYVTITGRLRTRKWQDQSGQDRYTTEILVAAYGGEIGFLDRQAGGQSGGDGGGGYGGQSGGQSGGATGGGSQSGGRPDYDDEIPF